MSELNYPDWIDLVDRIMLSLGKRRVDRSWPIWEWYWNEGWSARDAVRDKFEV